MERRYDVLAEAGMRDITGYNEAIERGELDGDAELDDLYDIEEDDVEDEFEDEEEDELEEEDEEDAVDEEDDEEQEEEEEEEEEEEDEGEQDEDDDVEDEEEDGSTTRRKKRTRRTRRTRSVPRGGTSGRVAGAVEPRRQYERAAVRPGGGRRAQRPHDGGGTRRRGVGMPDRPDGSGRRHPPGAGDAAAVGRCDHRRHQGEHPLAPGVLGRPPWPTAESSWTSPAPSV